MYGGEGVNTKTYQVIEHCTYMNRSMDVYSYKIYNSYYRLLSSTNTIGL